MPALPGGPPRGRRAESRGGLRSARAGSASGLHVAGQPAGDDDLGHRGHSGLGSPPTWPTAMDPPLQGLEAMLLGESGVRGRSVFLFPVKTGSLGDSGANGVGGSCPESKVEGTERPEGSRTARNCRPQGREPGSRPSLGFPSCAQDPAAAH